jgi:hypothetical protein
MKKLLLVLIALGVLPLGAFSQEKGETRPFNDFLRQSEKTIEQSLAQSRKHSRNGRPPQRKSKRPNRKWTRAMDSWLRSSLRSANAKPDSATTNSARK